MTLRDLASRSGLSLRFLMDVEAGRGNISVKRLADLAAALKTTPADLVTPPATSSPTVIALLGLRGAGKTTIGRRLAGVSGCRSSSWTARSKRARASGWASSFRCTARTTIAGSSATRSSICWRVSATW